MPDLTVLYYTANLVEEPFATNIRRNLLALCNNIPIISISHKPMDFGQNICVAGFEYSIYNIYRQILIGAEAAKTKYVLCAEDDALYNTEHFNYRPSEDTFAYNVNRWMVHGDIFFHRNRINMSMGIAPTELMVDTLTKRFAKFPQLLPREQLAGFGEPGRFENKLGLPTVKMETFVTQTPTLVFNHRPSVGGVRKLLTRDVVKDELPYWGKASEIWEKMYSQ